MNTWYNGKEINIETLIEELKNSSSEGGLNPSTEAIFGYIASTNYTGRKEDLACIVEKLNEKGRLGYEYPCPNLQTVERIISQGEWFFSQRDVKILFTKSGRGTTTTRITLPSTWIKAMGITEEERDVTISFKENKIIIEKK